MEKVNDLDVHSDKNNTDYRMIESSLEKIIFNEQDLLDLKKIIDEFEQNKVTKRDLKRLILGSRTRMLREIVRILPFYLELIGMRNESMSCIETQNKDSNKVLTNKDLFLELLGRKIEGIYTQLRNRKTLIP